MEPYAGIKPAYPIYKTGTSSFMFIGLNWCGVKELNLSSPTEIILWPKFYRLLPRTPRKLLYSNCMELNRSEWLNNLSWTNNLNTSRLLEGNYYKLFLVPSQGIEPWCFANQAKILPFGWTGLNWSGVLELNQPIARLQTPLVFLIDPRKYNKKGFLLLMSKNPCFYKISSYFMFLRPLV